MELIDLLLDAASYLDAHHDNEAVRLRAELRAAAERRFVEESIGDVLLVPLPQPPLMDLLPMVPLDRQPKKPGTVSLAELIDIGGEG